MSIVLLKSLLPVYLGLMESFNNKPDETLRGFNGTIQPLRIVLEFYNHWVSEGELEPIESLDIDIKNKLWEHVKTACPIITVSKAKDLSRAIWVFNSTLNK